MPKFKFVWDDSKNTINSEKHGVTFEESRGVWDDPLFIVGDCPEPASKGEKRFMAIGKIARGDIVSVVFTFREGTIRLISARPGRKERKIYEKEVAKKAKG